MRSIGYKKDPVSAQIINGWQTNLPDRSSGDHDLKEAYNMNKRYFRDMPFGFQTELDKIRTLFDRTGLNKYSF